MVGQPIVAAAGFQPACSIRAAAPKAA